MALPEFSGEFGGIIAGAFISGCISGYTFARETIVKVANKRINDLNQKVSHLEEEYQVKVEDLSEKYHKETKDLRDFIIVQAKKHEDMLAEQDEKCEQRRAEAEKRHDKRVKALEDRVVELEESRLEIAMRNVDVPED